MSGTARMTTSASLAAMPESVAVQIRQHAADAAVRGETAREFRLPDRDEYRVDPDNARCAGCNPLKDETSTTQLPCHGYGHG
jgi:hypothetical protein